MYSAADIDFTNLYTLAIFFIVLIVSAVVIWDFIND